MGITRWTAYIEELELECGALVEVSRTGCYMPACRRGPPENWTPSEYEDEIQVLSIQNPAEYDQETLREQLAELEDAFLGVPYLD